MSYTRINRAYRQNWKVKRRILERDGYQCQICGCGIGQVCDLHWSQVGQLDVAHIIPWAESQDSSDSNLRAVCHPCNMRERSHTEGQPVFTA